MRKVCRECCQMIWDHPYITSAKDLGGWHSRSKQRTDQRVLILTLKFLALKKQTGFPPVKNTFKFFFDFCSPLFYATFKCLQYFQKKLN